MIVQCCVVSGVAVPGDPLVSGSELDAIPPGTEPPQLRDADQLPGTPCHLHQSRRTEETRTRHRQEPHQDRT